MLLMLSFALAVIAGAAKAIMDTYTHHYDTSFFAKTKSLFFAKDSWRNKYKDGDKNKGEKFLFSTTLLCFTTDVWHLAQSIVYTCYPLAAILAYIEAPTDYVIANIVFSFIAIRAIVGLTFQILYTLFSK